MSTPVITIWKFMFQIKLAWSCWYITDLNKIRHHMLVAICIDRTADGLIALGVTVGPLHIIMGIV